MLPRGALLLGASTGYMTLSDSLGQAGSAPSTAGYCLPLSSSLLDAVPRHNEQETAQKKKQETGQRGLAACARMHEWLADKNR